MDHTLELSGLDGGNPLAFLAALGTIRSLSLAWPDRQLALSWAVAQNAWRPQLHCEESLSADSILSALIDRSRQKANAKVFSCFPDLKVGKQVFQDYAQQAVQAASITDREWCDYVAAFGCEAIGDDETIADTALRTMSGAGHQHFVKFMRDLMEVTTPENLRSALFSNWTYADAGPSMRWDPADDRRYALRWNEPSGDPIRTVRGANLLAIEGLPLVPTIPVNDRLETTGFMSRGARNTFWTWPIWVAPANVDVVRSILAIKEIQSAEPSREKLLSLGIAEIFRSRRLTIGKFRNFAPALTV